MTFHMDVLKECFTHWIQLRICQVLMRQPKPMSENQLSRLLGIPLTTLHRSLKSLGKTGLIKSHKVGNASSWMLDDRSYLFETLKPVLEGLNSITPPLPYLKRLILKTLHVPKKYRMILFGSTAAGTDTPASDIDLCIVYPAAVKNPEVRLKEDLEQLQEVCMDKFGKTLNPYFIKDSVLAKAPQKELHRNILKGMKITP